MRSKGSRSKNEKHICGVLSKRSRRSVVSEKKPHVPGDGRRSDAPFFSKMFCFLVVFAFMVVALINVTNVLHSDISKSSRSEKYTRAQAAHLRAKSLIDEARFSEAEAAAQEALAQVPDFYRAFIDLGCIYIARGEYIRAENAYMTALRYVRDDTFDLEIIYFDLGAVNEKERRPAAAWTYYRKGYESVIHTGKIDWNDQHSKILKYVHDNDRAGFISYLKSRTGTPREVNGRERKLKALLYVKNQTVIDEAEQYLADNPGSIYAYLFHALLATAYLDSGSLDKAEKELKILEAMGLTGAYRPWLKDSFAHLYYRRGDQRRAARILREVIRDYPDYESRDAAKEFYEELNWTGQ